MTENVVIKGGSRVLDSAVVDNFAIIELHSVVKDTAIVQDHAVISRSVVQDAAIVQGTAKVKDAVIGGEVVLSIEYVGKNGYVTDNTHLTYIKVNGIGYTVHRTYSEAKGYSAQIMREDGTKITVSTLKHLIDTSPENRVLQYLFNARKKDFTENIE